MATEPVLLSGGSISRTALRRRLTFPFGTHDPRGCIKDEISAYMEENAGLSSPQGASLSINVKRFAQKTWWGSPLERMAGDSSEALSHGTSQQNMRQGLGSPGNISNWHPVIAIRFYMS